MSLEFSTVAQTRKRLVVRLHGSIHLYSINPRSIHSFPGFRVNFSFQIWPRPARQLQSMRLSKFFDNIAIHRFVVRHNHGFLRQREHADRQPKVVLALLNFLKSFINAPPLPLASVPFLSFFEDEDEILVNHPKI